MSNQGKISDYDTPITKFAKNANFVKFLNTTYHTSHNDEILLPELKKLVVHRTKKPRIIFLHTIGSHRDFCERSWKQFYKNDLSNNKQINCYKSSIRNTS
ncbi:sulfatase-like hydrolase/transferase, partial [Photobacterium sanguinicancri]|uniref:sulfatase-like hydrolase/transferase n=1 Tax=Photobacterium sanguinicancri TaxID=875932 RepID=UPI0034DE85DC